MAVGGGPLFGASNSRSASKALVEFRAGKMTYNTTTKMVSPDKRKGLLSVHQSDDQLMHLRNESSKRQMNSMNSYHYLKCFGM